LPFRGADEAPVVSTQLEPEESTKRSGDQEDRKRLFWCSFPMGRINETHSNPHANNPFSDPPDLLISLLKTLTGWA
jgi:hypothetical protein